MPLTGTRARRLLAGMLAVVAVAGCGSASAVVRTAPAAAVAHPTTAARSTQVDPTTDPVRIIGDWRVVRARGAKAGTPVRFGGQQFIFRQPCGELNGEWTAARGGLFLAESGGYPEKCLRTDNLNPLWLRTATRFSITGTGSARRLRILAGSRVVAVLRRGTYPSPGPDGSFLPFPAPRVTAAIRAEFAPPKALAAGLIPATERTLVGRWLPLGPVRPRYSDVVLTVGADGGWAGTDGCNVQASRWESGPDGLLLIDGFGQTLVGCLRGTPRASFADAARAGFHGSELVLLAHDGAVVERLRRA